MFCRGTRRPRSHCREDASGRVVQKLFCEAPTLSGWEGLQRQVLGHLLKEILKQRVLAHPRRYDPPTIGASNPNRESDRYMVAKCWSLGGWDRRPGAPAIHCDMQPAEGEGGSPQEVAINARRIQASKCPGLRARLIRR